MKRVSSIRHIGLAAAILIFLYASEAALQYFPYIYKTLLITEAKYQTTQYSIHGLLLVTWYLLLAAIINTVTRYFNKQYQPYSAFKLGRALKFSVALILSNRACSLFDIPSSLQIPIQQSTRVLSLAIIGYSIFQLIQNSDALLIESTPNQGDNLDARRRYTYMTMLKRVLLLFWVILIIAAILMTFPQIRSVSKALLTSAGIATTIVLFSARNLLENVFKGIQLAISQPVRIEDTITINGETGSVSAITLQYVVVTLSDHSQLIIPTADLLNNTFKNWTHNSNNLIGNVVFHVKYTMPVEAIEKKFNDLLEKSNYWDKNVAELEINSFTPLVIELKCIMSAKSGKQLSKLRNEIKKQMLAYMQKEYADSLPQ